LLGFFIAISEILAELIERGGSMGYLYCVGMPSTEAEWWMYKR
jgi:hypothetical protein